MTKERWLYVGILSRENSIFHHLGGMISQTVPRISSHKYVIMFQYVTCVYFFIPGIFTDTFNSSCYIVLNLHDDLQSMNTSF